MGYWNPAAVDQREKVGWWDWEGSTGVGGCGGEPTAPRAEHRQPPHPTGDLTTGWTGSGFSGITGSPHATLAVPVIPFLFRHLLSSAGANWVLGIYFRLPGCEVWATGVAVRITHLPKFMVRGLAECFPTDLPGGNEMWWRESNPESISFYHFILSD